MRDDRVVIDTNVLISASLLSTGRPRVIVELVCAANGVLLFSDETLEELRTRIMRRKFDPYVTQDARTVFMAQIEAVSEWVSITNSKMGCRDPEDDKFLETALLGEANCLITGDQERIVLSSFRGIPIMTPAGLLSAFEA